MGTVPVIFVDDLSDAQRRALTLADNQTAMMTGWDSEQLEYELDTLENEFDMSDFGFDVTLEDISEDIALDDTESSGKTVTCPNCGFEVYI